MGCGSFTSSDWASYSTSKGISSKSTARELYRRDSVKDEFEPTKITVRESRDSEDHPNSTPIILGLDVTGSMSNVLEAISKKINVVMEEIYDRKPVSDPQICFMAFGDTTCDFAPLQVTQFESDIRIAEQLNDIFFERGGGGNDGESYTLPWYFAARHTVTDAFEKRGKKGFLFTMGDEKWLDIISKENIKRFVGDDIQADLTAEELLAEVCRQYEVYHLLIEEGSNMRWAGASTTDKWQKLIGQRAVKVTDVEKIPEIIVSILEVAGGKDAKEVANSWDGTTAVVVKEAIKNLVATINEDNELIEF